MHRFRSNDPWNFFHSHSARTPEPNGGSGVLAELTGNSESPSAKVYGRLKLPAASGLGQGVGQHRDNAAVT